MIDRAAFGQIWADLTGCVTIWEGDPEPFIGPGVLVRLSVLSYEEVGRSERRYSFDSSTQVNTPYVVGTRKASISIVAQSTSSSAFALDVLELARLRMRMPAQLARFTALNMSVDRTDSITQLTTTVWDNQEIDAAAFSVHFRHALVVSDSAAAYSRRAAIPASIPAEDTGFISSVDTNNQVPGTIT